MSIRPFLEDDELIALTVFSSFKLVLHRKPACSAITR